MKISNLILILMMIGNFFLILVLIVTANTDAIECYENPLQFGATRLKEQNQAEVMCSCSLLKQNSPILYFNSNSTTIERQSSNRGRINPELFDLSGLNQAFIDDKNDTPNQTD